MYVDDNLLPPSMRVARGRDGRSYLNFGDQDNSQDQRQPMPTYKVAGDQGAEPDSSKRLSPKSTENIRRVHELVALYRCRFKPNLSDASVMGTLHSAASVIQIHFRYLKHLRDAGLARPATSQAPAESSGAREMETSGIYKEVDERSSDFINSED